MPLSNQPSSRHPLVVFLLILCIVSGLTALVSDRPPNSIETQLSVLWTRVWVFGLVVGPALFLFGLWLQPKRGKLLKGVLFEQVGVAALGAAAIVYAAAVIATAGVEGAVPAAIVFGFGVACAYRWWTLQQGINRARAAGRGEVGGLGPIGRGPRRWWRTHRSTDSLGQPQDHRRYRYGEGH